jgi:hypothetical protein
MWQLIRGARREGEISRFELDHRQADRQLALETIFSPGFALNGLLE